MDAIEKWRAGEGGGGGQGKICLESASRGSNAVTDHEAYSAVTRCPSDVLLLPELHAVHRRRNQSMCEASKCMPQAATIRAGFLQHFIPGVPSEGDR
eukprot:756726-Hanusia_phi.AAC.2